MRDFLFKARDGQTPLPPELRKGLILKNIQSMGELDEFEEMNIFKGLLWLGKQTQNPIDYQFWLSLHKKLFGEVWSWAGMVREKDHELANPDFSPPHGIWPNFKKLQEDMDYWLENKTFSIKQLAVRLHERMLTIHPFPNGNGRFSRILTEYFCKHYEVAGPTWGSQYKADPVDRRNRYIEAIEEARNKKNYDALERFIFS